MTNKKTLPTDTQKSSIEETVSENVKKQSQ